MRNIIDLIRANAREYDAIHGEGAAKWELIAGLAAIPILWVMSCAFLLLGGSHGH